MWNGIVAIKRTAKTEQTQCRNAARLKILSEGGLQNVNVEGCDAKCNPQGLDIWTSQKFVVCGYQQ